VSGLEYWICRVRIAPRADCSVGLSNERRNAQPGRIRTGRAHGCTDPEVLAASIVVDELMNQQYRELKKQ